MKKLVMAIVIIVALGAIGWYGWNTMGGSLSQSPEELLATMQQNMMDVESAHFTGSLNFEGQYMSDLIPTSEFLPMDGATDKTVQEGVFMVDMTGAFAREGEEDYRGYTEAAIGYEMDGQTGSIALSMRGIDGMSYLQVGQLDIPVEGETAQMLDMVSGVVTGKWISLPEAEEGEDTTTDVDEQIKELFYQLEFLTNLEIEGTERIRGNKTMHITGKLNREDVRVFMIESRELSDDTMTEEERADLDASLDILEGMDIALWVGASDALLYKLQFGGPVVSEAEGVDGTFNLMLEMYDYGSDVEVVVPDGAMTFEQVVGQVMGAMMFGMMGDMDLDMMELDADMPTFDIPIE